MATRARLLRGGLIRPQPRPWPHSAPPVQRRARGMFTNWQAGRRARRLSLGDRPKRVMEAVRLRLRDHGGVSLSSWHRRYARHQMPRTSSRTSGRLRMRRCPILTPMTFSPPCSTYRVKEVLDADTVAVLLLDSSGRQLIATAASGLEEEVRQGVRIPVGKGFAGRIAAERRPVILNHVDHSNVLNPILLEKGIRSLVGVPLLVHGAVIGVLHVGTVHNQVFTSDDAALLQLAADRAALAVQSLWAREDRAATAALQRSLLPSALPVIGEAEIAARYVAGDGQIGGDWYDVFPLPWGELGVVVGDVAGSGLEGAVVMGRMRSALRSYALELPDTAEVLRKLDRKCSISRARSWPPCATPCSIRSPGSYVSHQQAISRRLSRSPASAVPWPRSPSMRRSASPMSPAARSLHCLSHPARCCVFLTRRAGGTPGNKPLDDGLARPCARVCRLGRRRAFAAR